MSKKRCRDCYYGNVCPSKKTCADFSPITEEGEEAVLDEIIETRRNEFREAWNEYINEYIDTML